VPRNSDSPVRVIVLSSVFLRHHYVINTLASKLDVVGVWQEEKRFQPLTYARDESDAAVIERHFAARDESEAIFFKRHETLTLAPGAIHRMVAPSGCNDPAEVSLMRNLSPGLVVVFGTGILREPVIEPFDGHIINLHLGLSPYYRGAGTNFWPLVNREPECVGATIHYLDAGVDSGPIIGHVRPEVAVDDGPHDLGNKTVLAAGPMLAEAAILHTRGTPRAVPQSGAGRLYQRKHFSADSVRVLYRQFETGMIEEYLLQKTERDRRLNLVALEAV